MNLEEMYGLTFNVRERDPDDEGPGNTDDPIDDPPCVNL